MILCVQNMWNAAITFIVIIFLKKFLLTPKKSTRMNYLIEIINLCKYMRLK